MNFFLKSSACEYTESLADFLKQNVVVGAQTDKENQKQSKIWQGLIDLGIFEVCTGQEADFSLQSVAALVQEFGHALVDVSVGMQAVLGSCLLTRQLNQTDRESLAKLNINKLTTDLIGVTSSIASNSTRAIAGQAVSKFVPVIKESKYLLFEADSDVYLCQLSDCVRQVTTAIDLSLTYQEVTADLSKAIKLTGINSKTLGQYKLLLISNEVAGIVKKVCKLTTEYVKTRKQFGVTLGSFQAIQHKLSDMQVTADSLESLSLFAAWALANSPDQSNLALSAATEWAVSRGLEAIEQSIQAHGGIGFTWEYELHYYLRRVLMYRALYSTTSKQTNELLLPHTRSTSKLTTLAKECDFAGFEAGICTKLPV